MTDQELYSEGYMDGYYDHPKQFDLSFYYLEGYEEGRSDRERNDND